MRRLGEKLFHRVRNAGAIRPDVSELDVAFLLELLSQTRLGDADRTAELRQRFLGIILDGLRPGSASALPGTSPTWGEQEGRWVPAAERV
jgi:hypothetical protein